MERELEFRHFMEFSSQEGYIFGGDYQQMETDDREFLICIEAFSQVDNLPRPAGRSVLSKGGYQRGKRGYLHCLPLQHQCFNVLMGTGGYSHTATYIMRIACSHG
ncbi:hypothetical protein AMTR_s00009p00263160 [Amborella trichopoda]|uniref:Uncharacterized protein n=1 Tax=Amborella trichopoda TaxID=13333 RepID=W1NI69_AMBTC|nr:hypothetical protein AMTR_s00009p00263160 [Amborella trichopoda]